MLRKLPQLWYRDFCLVQCEPPGVRMQVVAMHASPKLPESICWHAVSVHKPVEPDDMHSLADLGDHVGHVGCERCLEPTFALLVYSHGTCLLNPPVDHYSILLPICPPILRTLQGPGCTLVFLFLVLHRRKPVVSVEAERSTVLLYCLLYATLQRK